MLCAITAVCLRDFMDEENSHNIFSCFCALSFLSSALLSFAPSICAAAGLLAEGRKASAPRKSQADTFAAWHREFGVASESTLESRDMMSDFKNNSRIYGKTKHHQAFKSLAVTMKRGNLTK